MFGFLNVDKPSGITSHKVISILRKITGIKQIGHAGTLDPLASGVLPVAIGKASKLIDYLDEDKEYIAGIYLGKVSDTYDIQGKVELTFFRKISLEEIKEALSSLTGKIWQIPPVFSAVHYNGKRLYELARKGKIPDDIPKREVKIYKNEILSFDYEKQTLYLDIACSKGTYIRSIVNDLGVLLGSGAVMYELKRIKSSGLSIENAIDISENESEDFIKSHLINPIDIINIDTYELNDEECDKLKNGNKFKDRKKKQGNILLVRENKIMAIAEIQDKYVQPRRVLL